MNPFIPAPARIVEKHVEARQIFTFRLQFDDPMLRESYSFRPGQFNMVYAFGVGEVPISIVSDPTEECLDHTIRVVGGVTRSLDGLKKGDVVGIRGPYGSSWPVAEAEGKDVVVLTGGLGCAPVTSVIHYIFKRREAFGKLKILHGIKTPKDLLYRERFREWESHPDTEVYLTVDHPDRKWKYNVGVVTNLFREVRIEPENTIVMICGPEVMMRGAIRDLLAQGLSESQIHVSLERNMKCAVGFCGHCQFGSEFICRNGPVFRYDQIKRWFSTHEI